MPADNGSGCHLDERFLPSSPAPSQYDPEQLVCRSESPARALGVKSEQLLTQGKIFEDDILAGPECTNNPAEEVPEPYDHAQNLTGTLPIELGAKSLILRVYDVLMSDKGSEPPPRLFGVESQQLLTQGKVFEDQVLAGTERSNNPSEEVPEQQNHGRILSDDSKTAPSPSCWICGCARF